MGKTIFLIAVAVVFLVVAIVTWGSVGSGLCIYGFIMVLSALLLHWYHSYREKNDMEWE